MTGKKINGMLVNISHLSDDSTLVNLENNGLKDS